MIRIAIPVHLRTLAKVNREVELQIEAPVSLGMVLDALEDRYPVLRGTIRDHVTKKCRPFIRFFVTGEDWTHEAMDTLLPDAITSGVEPLRIVGAMAGG